MALTSTETILMAGEQPEQALVRATIPTVVLHLSLSQRHKPCVGWFRITILLLLSMRILMLRISFSQSGPPMLNLQITTIIFRPVPIIWLSTMVILP